ncbi:hypothetical protein UA08_06600 [Talaromyces atroroseus]|uniref:DUF4396 domain-containing protein n=1 Tax=Talaromyces atroroseus TaxID=1441469 RepID=A0A225AAY1_TALAT|nr:hypothetical protein UA08_06600 [Talaromyces atroroseus]OKL58062.1 hypothetical protein UA08_06600 [Talaromyces atroroseus]
MSIVDNLKYLVYVEPNDDPQNISYSELSNLMCPDDRIPVYLLNSLYLAPITLWVYFKYGRPRKPASDSKTESKHSHCHNDDNSQNGHEDHEGKHAEMGHSSRPMFATLTVAACHCGAGCLLGDIVGEWLVYGTDARINGKLLWVEYLVDYGFALLFGIIFQYFSIAPMSNDYGPRTIWRALKADILSLTAFQVGLYGWMAIYQIAIWNYRLRMNNVVYWWMMQVGMFAGHWTSAPMNWLLIRYRVKEPCA